MLWLSWVTPRGALGPARSWKHSWQHRIWKNTDVSSASSLAPGLWLPRVSDELLAPPGTLHAHCL